MVRTVRRHTRRDGAGGCPRLPTGRKRPGPPLLPPACGSDVATICDVRGGPGCAAIAAAPGVLSQASTGSQSGHIIPAEKPHSVRLNPKTILNEQQIDALQKSQLTRL